MVTPTEQAVKAFSKYKEVGQTLRKANSHQLQCLNSFLETTFLQSCTTGIPPFCFILASSGLGKTQLVFSLKHHTKVIYIPMAPKLTGRRQPIYEYFLPLYEILREALERDLIILARKSLSRGALMNIEHLSKDELLDLVNFDYLRTHNGIKFNTLGLLCGILSAPNFWSGVFDPYSIKDLPIPLLNLQECGQFELPIVFLDEFNVSGSYYDTALMVLARNLFRAAKVRTVVMGTDANASNLFRLGRSMSRSDSLHVWVYIWTALPPYPDSMLIQGRKKHLACAALPFKPTIELLYELVKTERPLIIGVLQSFLEKNVAQCSTPLELFGSFIEYLKDELLIWKPSLVETNEEMLMASADFLEDTGDRVRSFHRLSSINGHFAIFGTNEKVEHVIQNYCYSLSNFTEGLIFGRKYPFLYLEANSGGYFRSFCEETCLRLALGGWKNQLWHWSNKGAECFAKKLHNLYTVSRADKSLHPKRKGFILETLIDVSLIQASRLGGIAGTPLNVFMIQFLKNFLSTNVCALEIPPLHRNSSGTGIFDKIVGCMAPLNGVWPKQVADWAKDQNISLLNARSPKDAEQIDLSIENVFDNSQFIVVEAKNHAQLVSSAELIKIFSKCSCGNPTIVLIVVNGCTKDLAKAGSVANNEGYHLCMLEYVTSIDDGLVRVKEIGNEKSRLFEKVVILVRAVNFDEDYSGNPPSVGKRVTFIDK